MATTILICNELVMPTSTSLRVKTDKQIVKCWENPCYHWTSSGDFCWSGWGIPRDSQITAVVVGNRCVNTGMFLVSSWLGCLESWKEFTSKVHSMIPSLDDCKCGRNGYCRPITSSCNGLNTCVNLGSTECRVFETLKDLSHTVLHWFSDEQSWGSGSVRFKRTKSGFMMAAVTALDDEINIQTLGNVRVTAVFQCCFFMLFVWGFIYIQSRTFTLKCITKIPIQVIY